MNKEGGGGGGGVQAIRFDETSKIEESNQSNRIKSAEKQKIMKKL